MSHAEPSVPPASPPAVTRRGLLKVSGMAGAGLLLSLSAAVPASAAVPVSLSAAEARLILQVAAVGAVFPVAFPAFGETGPASSRVTMARLAPAVRRLSAVRLSSVRAGLAELTGAGMLDVAPQRLLDGITLLSNSSGSPLTPVVALAIATVSTHFDPNADAAAQVWIGGLREMHRRGVRPLIGSRTVTRP